MTYIGRIWLPLAEYDLYWLIFTLTGRICSQSKVFCRSALLCRFNIPKTEWWGAGVVICLEWRADLHMAQLMPLPLTVSCFNKIQIGLTFLVPAHLVSPGKRAVKRVCVCLLFFRCLLIVCFLHFIPCCMCVCHWITYFLTYLQLVPASLCFLIVRLSMRVSGHVRACQTGLPWNSSRSLFLSLKLLYNNTGWHYWLLLVKKMRRISQGSVAAREIVRRCFANKLP